MTAPGTEAKPEVKRKFAPIITMLPVLCMPARRGAQVTEELNVGSH